MSSTGRPVRWPELSDLPELDADAVDPSAGAAGSRARLQSAETDGRWRHRYVTSRSTGAGGEAEAGAGGERLAALVPVYWAAGDAWPDPAYDPSGWPLPEVAAGGLGAGDLAAGRCLLVGGVYDRRTALHVPDDPVLAWSCLREVARIAAGSGRCLVFPFLYERARRLVDVTLGGRVRWCVLEREAQFLEVLRTGGEGARVRGVLRRDRRLIERAASSVTVVAWEDADEAVPELIAEHNVRLGRPDHPEFVRMRYARWAACEGVRVIVFDGRAGPLRGVLTALIWGDALELSEIGLPESDDPARLALYLDLLFHRPFAYARRYRLGAIRAGTAAHTPKASRGAGFEPLYGGVLEAETTRQLADEPDPRSAA
jgi:hypothetical protein